MICNRCKKMIPENRNYCPYCGLKLNNTDNHIIPKAEEKQKIDEEPFVNPTATKANEGIERAPINDSYHKKEEFITNTGHNSVNTSTSPKPKDGKYIIAIGLLAVLLCFSLGFIVYSNKTENPNEVTTSVSSDAPDPTVGLVKPHDENQNDNTTSVTSDVPDPTVGLVKPYDENQNEDTNSVTSDVPDPTVGLVKPYDNEDSNDNKDKKEEHPPLIDIPDYYYTYAGHSYTLYNADDYDLTSYSDVKDFCKKQGGYLAVINDPDENRELFDIVVENSDITAFFGYSDETTESVWKWAHGSSNYTNWQKSDGLEQPDNGKPWGGDEDYAEFYYEAGTDSPNDGTWNDAEFMRNTSLFICEWDYELDIE